LCWSWAICCRSFFREIPGQHELGFEYGSDGLDPSVERSAHPSMDWVTNSALDFGHLQAAAFLVPLPVQVFGHRAELNEEIARQVFRLDFAALFLPQVD
jgi:hypothetical protein